MYSSICVSVSAYIEELSVQKFVCDHPRLLLVSRMYSFIVNVYGLQKEGKEFPPPPSLLPLNLLVSIFLVVPPPARVSNIYEQSPFVIFGRGRQRIIFH